MCFLIKPKVFSLIVSQNHRHPFLTKSDRLSFEDCVKHNSMSVDDLAKTISKFSSPREHF